MSNKLKRGDDSGLFAAHTCYDPEEDFTGELLTVAIVFAAETHLPDLRSECLKFKRSKIGEGDRLTCGLNDFFAVLLEFRLAEFVLHIFGKQRDEFSCIAFDESVEKFAGKFVFSSFLF